MTEEERAREYRMIADALSGESRRFALVAAILTGAHSAPDLATDKGRSQLAARAVHLANLAEMAFSNEAADFDASELRDIVQSERYRSCRIVIDPSEEGAERRLLEFAIVDHLGREITFCGPPHFIVRRVAEEIMHLDARQAARPKEES